VRLAVVAQLCVICKKAIPADPKRRPGPFCSETCRTIDLGNWADGVYRVPVEEEHSDLEGPNADHRLS
jgi:endogenous inhibitor of DNA gyrase (YacG/DUF329 family)